MAPDFCPEVSAFFLPFRGFLCFPAGTLRVLGFMGLHSQIRGDGVAPFCRRWRQLQRQSRNRQPPRQYVSGKTT